MYSSKKSVLQTVKLLEKKNRETANRNPDAVRIANDLDTIRRLLANMSERAYRVHIEAEERPGGFFKKLAATAAIVLVFSITAFGQVPTMATPSQSAAIASMFLSDSADFDTTYTVAGLPVLLRSNCVALAFDKMGFHKFETWFTPLTSPPDFTNTMLQSKGACRGISLSVPVKTPGIYTVVFNAAAMQLTVTPSDLHEAGHIVYLKFNYK